MRMLELRRNANVKNNMQLIYLSCIAKQTFDSSLWFISFRTFLQSKMIMKILEIIAHHGDKFDQRGFLKILHAWG
jgi:hypothetical protein